MPIYRMEKVETSTLRYQIEIEAMSKTDAYVKARKIEDDKWDCKDEDVETEYDVLEERSK